MATVTPNVGLNKPELNEYFNLEVLNGNLDKIDSEFKKVSDEVTSQKVDIENLKHYSILKSGKDSNGIYTTVEIKRTDGTLYMKSVLSGGISPKYTTRTESYYKVDGVTVYITKTYTRTYDSDDMLVSEVIA